MLSGLTRPVAGGLPLRRLGTPSRRPLLLRPHPPQEGCYPKEAVMEVVEECMRKQAKRPPPPLPVHGRRHAPPARQRHPELVLVQAAGPVIHTCSCKPLDSRSATTLRAITAEAREHPLT